VVSARRNAISWVFFALVALGCASVSGNQPKDRVEPYVAPLLPAEQAWLVAPSAPPAAGGAMDRRHVYVPLQAGRVPADGGESAPANVTALHRETGTLAWTYPAAATVPPVAAGGTLFVAAGAELHAIDTSTGTRAWTLPLAADVREPMLARGALLLAITDGDELVAVRTDMPSIAWRRSLGPSGRVRMNASARAAFLTTEAGTVTCIALADGSVAWQRTLEGALSEPAIAADRVLVGSTTNAFWALDPESGDDEWRWQGRIFGGDVMGAAVEDDAVYVVSLDNIVRALNAGNGNQRWKQAIGTRPVLPPRAFFGTVVVTGLAPTLSTFVGETGVSAGTWSAPPDAELQGVPLIDEHLIPFGVAAVVITRDGRAIGLRPTAMMFREPPSTPLTTVPGRVLPRERLPGEPEPAPVPLATPPRP
jgi:PQQ-like domain